MICVGSNWSVAKVKTRVKTGGREAQSDADREALGDRVLALRTFLETLFERKVPQAEIADRGGFDRTEMSLFEQGKKLSSLENAAKLARGYEVTLDAMKRYLDGEMTPKEVFKHMAPHDPATTQNERYQVMPLLRLVAERDGYDYDVIRSFAANLDLDGQPTFTELWAMFVAEVNTGKRAASGDPLSDIDRPRVRPASKKT